MVTVIAACGLQCYAQSADLVEKAKGGSALHQRILGNYYMNQKDYATGVEWYRKSAAQNDVGAQYNLGIHEKNNGNIEEARKWWELSAKQGYPDAMYELGCYYLNNGDFTKGNDFVDKAAQNGCDAAQVHKGLDFQRKKEYAKAEAMFKNAAEQGNAIAQYHLVHIITKEERKSRLNFGGNRLLDKIMPLRNIVSL